MCVEIIAQINESSFWQAQESFSASEMINSCFRRGQVFDLPIGTRSGEIARSAKAEAEEETVERD